MTHLHNQTTTASLTEQDYAALLAALGEQLAAQCLTEGYPEDQASDAVCDALVNTYQTSGGQTVLEWLITAGARLCVSTQDCVGV